MNSEPAPAQLSNQEQAAPARPRCVCAIIEVWSRYRELARGFNASVDELSVIERRGRGLTEEQAFAAVIRPFDSEFVTKGYVETDEIAAKYSELLLRTARQEFGSFGKELGVSAHEVSGQCKAARAESFDPAEMWDFLERRYGSKRDSLPTNKECAATLGAVLKLTPGSDVKIAGGRVVLPAAGIHHNPEALLALVAVLKWSGLYQEADGEAVRQAMPICSRESRQFEIGRHISLRNFTEKSTFRLSIALAEQLQLFVTNFRGSAGR